MPITDDITTSDALAMGDAPAEIPAGDARRDALKAAYDELQLKSEQIAAELGLERANPKSYRRMRDESIRPHDPDLMIKHPQSAYVYSWVYRDPRGTLANRIVHSYEARGWEVVTGAMPEAKGMRINAENAVWNADCVLMRCRKDVRLVAEQKDWAKRRQREGINAELMAKAQKYGVNVREEVPASVRPQVMQASAAAAQSVAAKQGFARQMAAQKLENAIRTGTVPGAPVGR